MSLDLYAIFEFYDTGAKEWKPASFFYYDEKGMLREADLVNGSRSAVNALFGEEGFDDGVSTDLEERLEELDDMESARRSALMKLDDIMHGAILSRGCPADASAKTKDTFAQYGEGDFGLHYMPGTATYTLDDFSTIEVLAALISNRAKRFYETYFKRTHDTLNLVAQTYSGLYCKGWEKHVRVILYGM